MDEKGLKVDISNKIRQLREKSGLSIYQLGAACGMSAQRISSLEAGKQVPMIATLIKLADGLGVSVFDILDEPLGRDYDAEIYNPKFSEPCKNARICPFFKPVGDKEANG